MSEVPKELDAETLALIENPPSEFRYTRKQRSQALRVVNKAAQLLLSDRANPPFERLKMPADPEKFFGMLRTIDATRAEAVANGLAVINPCYGSFSNESCGYVIDDPNISVEEAFRNLTEYILKSPLRLVTAPLDGATLSVISMHPEAEDLIRARIRNAHIGKMSEIPLPEISMSDCAIGIRNDRWANPRTGNPRWIVIPLTTMVGIDLRDSGGYPAPPETLGSMEAIVDYVAGYALNPTS